MISWNPALLERHIAPEITEFSKAEIPDLSASHPQAARWVANHFLNSVFRAGFTGSIRQLVAAFLRKAYQAFGEYHDARTQTYRFLETHNPGNPSTTKYFSALSHWESLVLQVQMCIALWNTLFDLQIFNKGDGSKEARIHELGNRVKHFSSDLATQGKVPEHVVAPLWLNNQGLTSYNLIVSYAEAAEILTDIAESADDLQDAKTFRRKLDALIK